MVSIQWAKKNFLSFGSGRNVSLVPMIGRNAVVICTHTVTKMIIHTARAPSDFALRWAKPLRKNRQPKKVATAQNEDLVCLMIDLDNFKSVNDTLGHAAGDEVIRVAADTLRASCRPDDLPARLGGDEFTILMNTQGVHQATAIAQRIQDEFHRRIETALTGKTAKSMPSMSIGITSLRSAAAKNLAELMSHADTALYQAKHGGKARAQVYTRDAA